MGRSKRETPLDEPGLTRLALSYVGRFATTRSKLAAYLSRKVRERGWSSAGEPPIDAVADRCVASGYVDDAAFAAMRATALSRRGYGARRISAALSAAGVANELSEAVAPDDEQSFAAAESYARRKKIGPFAAVEMDAPARQRAFAAMIRAGHSYSLARQFTQAGRDERSEI